MQRSGAAESCKETAKKKELIQRTGISVPIDGFDDWHSCFSEIVLARNIRRPAKFGDLGISESGPLNSAAENSGP